MKSDIGLEYVPVLFNLFSTYMQNMKLVAPMVHEILTVKKVTSPG